MGLIYISDDGEVPAGLRTLSHEFNRYVSFNFVGSPDKAVGTISIERNASDAYYVRHAHKSGSAGGENDPKAAGQDEIRTKPTVSDGSLIMEMNGQVQYGNTKEWLQRCNADGDCRP